MGTIVSLFTSRLAGPIASVVALVLALALAASLLTASATEKSLRKQIDDLQRSIDNPATGWRARLSQCQHNVGVATASLATQNAAVATLKAANAAATAKAESNAAAARAASAGAQAAVNSILNQKPGADHCASALALIRSH